MDDYLSPSVGSSIETHVSPNDLAEVAVYSFVAATAAAVGYAAATWVTANAAIVAAAALLVT